MLLLILGVALWAAAHSIKRIAPGFRESLGEKGAGLVAGLLLVAILLMVFGYRMADGAFFWGRSPATVGIMNLLMVIAVYFMSPGPSKGAIFYRMRHPMLTGFALWALGHLIVNGDVASFILFGGLGAWALMAMVMINRAEPEWTPNPKGTIAKDGMFLVASVVLMVVIGYIHGWLGAPAFG